MFVARFDLPCYAPQTLAFLVRRDELAEVRAALRDFFERGDDTAVRATWNRLRSSLAVAKRERRWRVPRATVERLCIEAIAMCAEDPSRRDELATATSRFHDRVPRASPDLVVAASRWHALERAFGPMRFARQFSSFFVAALDALFDEADEERWHPLESLSYVASARVEGEEVRCTIDGEEIVDELWTFRERVRAALDVQEIFQALVGPFEMSRGPGPFLPRPSAARPLVDCASRLPVLDDEPLAHVLVDAADITAALAETRAWREPREPLEWSPTEPPWDVPWSALAPRWEAYRDRFVDLLREAHDTERAVLFVDAEVGDLGPGGNVPVDASWGVVVV